MKTPESEYYFAHEETPFCDNQLSDEVVFFLYFVGNAGFASWFHLRNTVRAENFEAKCEHDSTLPSVKKRPKNRTFSMNLFFTETAETSPHTLKKKSIQPVLSTSQTQKKVIDYF